MSDDTDYLRVRKIDAILWGSAFGIVPEKTGYPDDYPRRETTVDSEVKKVTNQRRQLFGTDFQPRLTAAK